MTDKEKAHKIKKIDRQMKLIAIEGKLDSESKRKFINRVGNIIFYNEDSEESDAEIHARIKRENTAAMGSQITPDMFVKRPWHGLF